MRPIASLGEALEIAIIAIVTTWVGLLVLSPVFGAPLEKTPLGPGVTPEAAPRSTPTLVRVPFLWQQDCYGEVKVRAVVDDTGVLVGRVTCLYPTTPDELPVFPRTP